MAIGFLASSGRRSRRRLDVIEKHWRKWFVFLHEYLRANWCQYITFSSLPVFRSFSLIEKTEEKTRMNVCRHQALFYHQATSQAQLQSFSASHFPNLVSKFAWLCPVCPFSAICFYLIHSFNEELSNCAPGTGLTGATALNKAINPALLELAVYHQTDYKQDK